MLKKRYKWRIAISILLTGALLTGCSDYLEDTINPPSYHEMGYVVEGVDTYGNDINMEIS